MPDHDQPPATDKPRSNVIRLSDVLNDATMYSVEDMLHEALERVRENKGIKKGIVIFLDKLSTPGNQILWHTVGMTKVQHLRLLSNAKDEYLVEYALGHTHSWDND